MNNRIDYETKRLKEKQNEKRKLLERLASRVKVVQSANIQTDRVTNRQANKYTKRITNRQAG